MFLLADCVVRKVHESLGHQTGMVTFPLKSCTDSLCDM